MNKKSRENISRFSALVCVTTLSMGLVLGGCAGSDSADAGGQKQEPQKDNSILVETAAPKTGSIELTGSFMGTVEMENEVTVVAKVGGDVTAAYFEEGDKVNAGDLLFTIDDRSARISVTQAQASLESANATLNSASAGVAAAQKQLDYTQAQIAETLGAVGTNALQLENAVSSAGYTVTASQRNYDFGIHSYEISSSNMDEVEEMLEVSEKTAEEKRALSEEMWQIVQNYEKLRNAAGKCGDSTSELYQVLSDLGYTYTDLGLSPDTEGEWTAEVYLKNCDSAYYSVYNVAIYAATLEHEANIALEQGQAAEANKEAAELALHQSRITVQEAKDNVSAAEDAQNLAEKMLWDYNAYTVKTIQTGTDADYAATNAKLVSAQDAVTQAQAGVTQAQAGVDAAQLQLENTKMAAPVSGVIIRKNIMENSVAAQGMEAYVIAADEGINIVFYVVESVMRELSIGQKVTVERNGSTYSAEITENLGMADAKSGLFEVKARLVGSVDLIAGTSVKLTLATQSADNVLTVPVDCVYYENQKAFVYCMADGKAVKTQIETGITNNEEVEVKSGLTGKSQVIVNWASKLKDGAEVKLKDAVQGEVADE